MGRRYLGYRESISTSLQASSRLGTERFTRSCLLTGEIWMTEIIFFPYGPNFPGKKFCLVTKSTSQQETLPGERDNISPDEQNKNI